MTDVATSGRLEQVQDYYGTRLRSSTDLRTEILKGAGVLVVSLTRGDKRQLMLRSDTDHMIDAGYKCVGFIGARMDYADLSHADLSRADLRSAKLGSANLHAIRDEGARWEGALTVTAKPTDPMRLKAENWQPPRR